MERVCLKACSIQDCDVISSLLQDSILTLSSHKYYPSHNCLRLMLNRFCWESQHKIDEEQCYHRVHSGLYIHNVKNVFVNNNFYSGECRYLNLLAMHASEKEINLLFSENKHMYVEIDGLLVYLKDLHDKYPTSIKPEHLCA